MQEHKPLPLEAAAAAVTTLVTAVVASAVASAAAWPQAPLIRSAEVGADF